MSFTSNNLAPEKENFPKLKLGAKESARVHVYETPVAAYVHNLRAPKIVDGRVAMVMDNRTKVMVWDYDFVANPLCLGDAEEMEKSGSDPKNCPACKAVKDHGWDLFKPAQRKFAMHVFQYTTNGSSAAPKGFNGEVKIWAFADKKFGELVAIANEYDGDLSKADLLLGPCENATFQLFNIVHSAKVAWKQLGITEDAFHALTDANKSKDLYFYLGRKMTAENMKDKVDEIVAKTRQANGLSGESASDDLAGAENLDAGLASILDDTTPAPVASRVDATPPADNDADFDDILKSLG
jgi:hypothetical protein